MYLRKFSMGSSRMWKIWMTPAECHLCSLEAPADFEDNNPSPAEKPSEVMDLAQDGTADNPVPLQGSSSTSESNNSDSEDSTAYKEDAWSPEKAGEEQQADMEDETGLLPDSQVHLPVRLPARGQGRRHRMNGKVQTTPTA
jgi:hypothetical protein